MTDWAAFWDRKAEEPTDFGATGRSRLEVVGYLHTVAEIAQTLQLAPTDEVLDVGCGTGLLTLSIAPFVAQVYAVDISQGMVQRARLNLAGISNVVISKGSITGTLRPDMSVDKVLAYSVLQYLASEDDIAAAMAEVRRVLRPGGRAMLAANPDPRRRRAYDVALGLDAEEREGERKAVNSVLWVEGSRLLELAAESGCRAEIRPISERIWQHFYMFNLLLERDG
jgi:SAM-dependent methyltransferase